MTISVPDAIKKYRLTDTIEQTYFYFLFLNAQKKFHNIIDLPEINEKLVDAILKGNGEQVKTEGGGMYFGMHSVTVYDFNSFVMVKWERHFFATPFGSRYKPESKEGIILAPKMTDGVRNRLNCHFDGRESCYRIIK